MDIIISVVLVAISLYLGYVQGLYIQCHTYKELKGAKKYISMLPFLMLVLSGEIIKESLKEKKIGYLIGFLKMEEKSIVVLFALTTTSKNLNKNQVEEKKRLQTIQGSKRVAKSKLIHAMTLM